MFLKLTFVLILAQLVCSQRSCPSGGCLCSCNCLDKQPIRCPICPPIGGTTAPPGTVLSGPCEQAIRAAFQTNGANVGALLGLVFQYLLFSLVQPILQIVLAGNNTVEGAVIPLANTLCTLVGLILLLLRSLGLLGVLGSGGLLGSLLSGLG